MERAFSFVALSFALAMLWAPLLIRMLYQFKIVRHVEKDFSTVVGERYLKAGTPIMGGLLVVITVAALTVFFNWGRGSTYVPIGVLLLSAILGGFDDVLNIYGKKNTVRTVQKQIKLAKIHKSWYMRIWYWLTLPITAYRNVWYALGSYPGTGIQAGEKILVQIAAGGMVAWWLYFKLGWDTIWLPWVGSFSLGWLMPIFIIFTIVSMANAVNIADGMDGLSAGMLIPAFTAYLFISLVQNNDQMAVLNATIIGSLLAYLYFNIKPARFQMGDVGSLALGAVLATIAFAQDRIFLLPIIGFMFVAEIGSSLLQGVFRRLFGRRLFKMAPIHLHFQIHGWSEERVVMRFWLFAAIFAFFGVWLSFQ